MSRKNLLSVFIAFITFLIITPSVLANEAEIISEQEDATYQMFDNSEEYWTKERMENAIPMDKHVDKATESKSLTDSEANENQTNERPYNTEPASPKYNNALDFSPNAVVPSTTGKLFFYNPNDGNNYVCSASAVNNPNKNLVSTAGHCMHEGSGGDFYTNIVFVPAYYEGNAPYGRWDVNWKVTFRGWTDNGNYDYDQAFLTVFQNDGRNLVNVVGGNGLSFNYSQNQSDVRVTGYPAADPYPGDIPYYCYGDTSKRFLSNDAQISCGFTGGASGGAWFRTMSSENLGQIFAVTSRRSEPRGTLYARPFTSDYRDLFEGMEDR